MIKRSFIVYFLSFLLLLLFLLAPSPLIAKGEIVSNKYSNVMEDLTKDEKFDVNKYPEKSGDYSLQVIQIAESKDNKLFVYVYQPSHYEIDLLATSVNISNTGLADNTKNYKLEIVSSSSVFDKYLVKGLTVSNETVRIYDVVSIFRKWNGTIDSESGTDNVINEISFPVGQCWYVTEQDGKTVYASKSEQVITVTDRWDGFITYDAGFDLLNQSCYSHFIAFNTDLPIDKLLEANVSFYHQNVYDFGNPLHWPDYSLGEKIYVDSLKITASETATNNPLFPWDKTFTWNRIVSVDEFLNENINFASKENLADKKWVLRFYESTFSLYPTEDGYWDKSYDQVAEVTILNLKFVTDGISYDLGVIDNKMTADNIADGVGIGEDNWFIISTSIILLCVAMIFVNSALRG